MDIQHAPQDLLTEAAAPAERRVAPIFIIGTPRSGTTLLARILDRHSRIFMPGETHFFPDIYARRREFGDLAEAAGRERVLERLRTLYRRYNEPHDQQRLDALLRDPRVDAALRGALTDYGAAFRTFMEVQAHAVGKPRWGNNTPKDLFFVGEILAMFPDARLVCCVRDVRDFVRSYRGKWQITAAGGEERLQRLYHPVNTALLWRTSMRQLARLRARLPADQLMEVRYERLVGDPEGTLRRLCDFLDEPYEPDMLNVKFSNSSEGHSAGGIHNRSVGRWRDALSPEEVWIAQKVAGEQMRLLGYRAEPVVVNRLRLARWIASTPWALWRALRANREHTGPVVPYLARRLGTLLRH